MEALPDPQNISEALSRTVFAYGHRITISGGRKKGGGHWHTVDGRKRFRDMGEAIHWCRLFKITDDPPRWARVGESYPREGSQ